MVTVSIRPLDASDFNWASHNLLGQEDGPPRFMTICTVRGTSLCEDRITIVSGPVTPARLLFGGARRYPPLTPASGPYAESTNIVVDHDAQD